MDIGECRLCTEGELKEKDISYEQEEWELKAVLLVHVTLKKWKKPEETWPLTDVHGKLT